MDCINELRDSLNVHLGWNNARITCFVNRLLALLTLRTVNLNKLACVVIGEAQLVYYEVHLDVYEAITREKRIKKWNRQWKINLIEENNPQWLNLANGLF